MKCICPECKNEINNLVDGEVSIGKVIECPTCGITLQIETIANDEIKTFIVDEGK